MTNALGSCHHFNKVINDEERVMGRLMCYGVCLDCGKHLYYPALYENTIGRDEWPAEFGLEEVYPDEWEGGK